MNIDVHNRFMTVSSKRFQTSFMLSICDANRAIFQNYVQPRISPHKLASAPVLPPMRSRSGSKYAFGNQHTSNCQLRGRLHRTNLGWKKLWLNTCWLLRFFQWYPFEVEELGAWVTQWTSPPQFASLLFFLKLPSEKNKANPKRRCRRNENLSLTWLTFKCICWWYKYNEVCNKRMWHVLVPVIPAETPSWPGTLVRTLKSTCPRLSCLLLQSCWHTCHFIQIQYLTHLQKLICLKILTRAEMIAADRPTVFCSCCYRQ